MASDALAAARRWRRGWPPGRRSTTGPARFPVEDFADLREAGLSACSCRRRLGGLGRQLRRLRGGRLSSWRGATGRPPWCSTCTPRSPGRWRGHRRAGRRAGRAGGVRRRARPDAGRGGGRGLLRGGDERAGRRLPAVAAVHSCTSRWTAATTSRVRRRFCLRRRARRRLSGGGPQRGRPSRWCRSSWCRPRRRAAGGADLGLAGDAGHLLARPAPGRHGAGRRAARRRGRAGPAGRPADAALDGGQLRRGLRRGGAARRGRGRAPTSPRAAWTGCRRCGPGSAGRTPRWRRRGWWWTEAARRVDAAPGDPETNRWVWRAKLLAGTTAAEVAASMLEAAGTLGHPPGHPLERLFRDARCGSLHPATSDVCADWLGVAALGGDPDRDGAAPRW